MTIPLRDILLATETDFEKQISVCFRPMDAAPSSPNTSCSLFIATTVLSTQRQGCKTQLFNHSINLIIHQLVRKRSVDTISRLKSQPRQIWILRSSVMSMHCFPHYVCLTRLRLYRGSPTWNTWFSFSAQTNLLIDSSSRNSDGMYGTSYVHYQQCRTERMIMHMDV